MVLSERERQIAIIAGIGLAALVLYYGVVDRYLKRRAEIATAIDSANSDLEKAKVLSRRRVQMRTVWNQMIDPDKGGLGTDLPEAQTRLENSLDDWAEKSDFIVSNRQLEPNNATPSKNTPEAKFQEVSFHITGTGSLNSLARLLWRLETASMPVRVFEVQISPNGGKEGKDDLIFVLKVSTLSRNADSDKNSRASADSSAGGQGGGS